LANKQNILTSKSSGVGSFYPSGMALWCTSAALWVWKEQLMNQEKPLHTGSEVLWHSPASFT
jgi:hypothetical protein